MNKVRAVVGLDFATMKPQLGLKVTLPLLLSVLWMVTMSGSVASGIGIGLMMAMLFSGLPFLYGGKNNLDALYATLSLDRKTVVKGRYLFTLTMNICAVAATFILGTIGQLTLALTGVTFSSDGIVWVFAVMGFMCIAMQAMQLPFYFKFGYQKAKLFSIVPLTGITGLAGVVLVMGGGELLNGITTFAAKFQENRVMLFGGIGAVLAVIVFASYKLSLVFYEKREF
ncbi:MAG: ABC-2 transporter permease [Oscillospiraceae bacterium]|nr:ABC-2 transporter permease [Oscillospiraceae bacterium]